MLSIFGVSIVLYFKYYFIHFELFSDRGFLSYPSTLPPSQNKSAKREEICPLEPTWPRSSVGRVLDWQTKGRWFDSHRGQANFSTCPAWTHSETTSQRSHYSHTYLHPQYHTCRAPRRQIDPLPLHNCPPSWLNEPAKSLTYSSSFIVVSTSVDIRVTFGYSNILNFS